VRHLAIGDIHGCFKALTTLAAYVPFESDDVLIALGDYVNRGPDSRAVLDWLIDYQRRGNLVPLRGNHEIMMLRARESQDAFQEFLRCGGDATLPSYAPAGKLGRLADVPESHWQFLEESRGWFETVTHFVVHASAYADCALEEQPDYMLYWESFEDSAPHQSGKTMICGHTSQKSGKPKNLGHAVCIDAWVYGDGWLTCLDVDGGRYWQTNQRGDARSCLLDMVD
jgi:serine/threonine protein phosphatase 1